MNVEIGTEAAQFPEKEYINGIFLAVHPQSPLFKYSSLFIQPSVPEIMNSKLPMRSVNRRAGGDSQNQGYPCPFIVVLSFLLIVQYSENHYRKLFLNSGSSVPFQFDCVHIWRRSEIICQTKVAYWKCFCIINCCLRDTLMHIQSTGSESA